MGEFGNVANLKDEIWEARWEADVRAAKALAVLKNKDEKICALKEENQKMRDRIFNTSATQDKTVLQERLDNAGIDQYTKV